MGICPRCGSWVDEGDVCRSCGGVREVDMEDMMNMMKVMKRYMMILMWI